MNNIIARVIKQPKRYWAKFLLNFSSLMSDKSYLKAFYMYTFGKPLNLDNPRTFCEKLQWLKLNDRNPMYTMMVDKYEVKKYITDKIGSEYVIPTLGVWDHPNEIEWDSLPDQFVLKTTHGGGGNGVIICKDKNTLDKKKVEMQLQKSLNADLYKQFREWPYKNVPRRILAEAYMNTNNSDYAEDLIDYKFFCFNGKPEYCQVIQNRSKLETIDFFDMSWEHMPFVGLNPNCSNSSIPVLQPSKFEEMKHVCRKLSEGIPFSRIDLYEVAGKVYFGEITLYPGSGIGRFTPDNWNYELGHLIELNINKR